jgi:maltose O-acetyltransferase
MRSQKSRMLAGEPYVADCPELTADRARAWAWMDRFNAKLAVPAEEHHAMLCELLARVGEGALVRPPFHCDYGYNISLGRDVFLNTGCIILDVAEVSIGDMTQIGPGVQLLAADHPRDPEQRRQRLEFGRPIRVGCNVWIGGGALVMPGVSVGDDAIIGAGAVVTRDVAPGTTVAGNPARLLTRRA